MKVLLDTCTILWAASEPECLSERAREVLSARDTAVFVSPISCAEVACLQERGRIVIEGHWKTWFNHCIGLNQWQVLDMTLAVVQEAYSLPDAFHRDPADRLIVGTARVHDLTVLTMDARILGYPHVNSLW